MFQLIELIEQLYPICRSITGEGVRKTLNIIKDHVSCLEIKSSNSLTNVFDWTIPPEWNINEAWIKNAKGEKIIDFANNNLHVVSYSIPVHEKSIKLIDFKEKLHYIEDMPEAIPYRTTYYNEDWGFCLDHNTFKKIEEDEDEYYEIFIDSCHKSNGVMNWGEITIEGKSNKQILISTYLCHPSMCNDNLSGVAVATELAKYLKSRKDNFYTYKIIFIPETIGAINWLSKNKNQVSSIEAGFILTCVGDQNNINVKSPRNKNCLTNKVINFLARSRSDINLLDYFPMGSDERQYCSPGFNLPISTIMRSLPGTFKEYHTSLDNLNFISEENLQGTLQFCKDIINTIELNFIFKNKIMFCEPQLGKRGLYRSFGGQKFNSKEHEAIKWLLNLSDGKNDLIDISLKSKIKIETLHKVSTKLLEKDLIEYCN